MNINQMVAGIVKKYNEDENFRTVVDASPEFYRACVYESGFVDAQAIDGTPLYHQLVDALEENGL